MAFRFVVACSNNECRIDFYGGEGTEIEGPFKIAGDLHYVVLLPAEHRVNAYTLMALDHEKKHVLKRYTNVYENPEAATFRFEEMVAILETLDPNRGWQSPEAQAKVSEHATVASC